MNFDRQTLGYTETGQRVERATLRNSRGMELRLLNYGGIVTHLLVPDRAGNLIDVVLGFDDWKAYLQPHPFLGAIIGRVAGRITGGRFELDGKTYPLKKNSRGVNHCHGGEKGLDKKVWEIAHANDREVCLTCRSPDGEEGYPGNATFRCSYRLDEENRLSIDYEATTDRPTPLNLTNHAYFNLGGPNEETIEDHELQIEADKHVPMDENYTLSGKLESVQGRPEDFNQPTRIGERSPRLWRQHGSLYRLRRSGPGLQRVARASAPRTGISMEVATTEPYLQLYTSSLMEVDRLEGKGRRFRPFSGLCLEAHNYPDGANHPELGDIVLRPGETYRQTTSYQFRA